MTLAVGLDLGGTNLRAALVDTHPPGSGLPALAGDLKLQLTSTEPQTVVEAIVDAVRRVTHSKQGAVPIGIGVAGMLRGETGVVENAPNLGWRGVDLAGMLGARLPGHVVRLANDVNAIAYGEFAFGAGRGARDVLCVYAGTGIGGGLIASGQLVIGASHMAGELGHTKVVTGPTARACGCGQRGCIEAYAGGARLAARAREELAAGSRSRAVELAGGADKVHAGHLDQAASEGDPYATRLWDEIAPLFGLVVANAVTLLNPARVIFGGGVLWGAKELCRRVLAAYQDLVNVSAGAACEIVEAALGDGAGVLGAAALAAVH
jgi:glucokinase